MALIKFHRFDGQKVILIPTKEGVEYFEKEKPTVVSQNNPSGIPLSKGEETIGETKLIAYIVDLGSQIVNYSNDSNIVLNTNKFRFFVQSGVNFFLNIHLNSPKDSRY